MSDHELYTTGIDKADKALTELQFFNDAQMRFITNILRSLS